MSEANNQASPSPEQFEACLRVLRWMRDGDRGLHESWQTPLTHICGCVRGCLEISKAERAGGREPATSQTPEPSTLASATGSASASQRVTGELQYKADLFDYLCWLETKRQAELPALLCHNYLVLASDGTTCWGKTYADAAKVAMNHDKGIQDAQTPNEKS